MFGSHKLFAPLKQLISDGKCLLILPATFQLSNAFVEIRGVIGFCGTVAIQNNNECEPTQKISLSPRGGASASGPLRNILSSRSWLW
jgi:hypothetical protein